jgi:hypothetical protein
MSTIVSRATSGCRAVYYLIYPAWLFVHFQLMPVCAKHDEL